MAGRGIGALIGPFIGRWWSGADDRRLFAAIAMSLTVFGCGYALLGFMPSLWLAAVAIGVAHLGGGAQWTLSSYGLQRIVPDRIRGRIFSFDFALITISISVSALVTGWAAERFGPRPTVTVLGGVAVVWAAVWAWLTTDVRRATLIDGCGPADEMELELLRPSPSRIRARVRRERLAGRRAARRGRWRGRRARRGRRRRRRRSGRGGARAGDGGAAERHARRVRAEVHLRSARLAERLVDLEELLLLEVEHLRDDRRGELLHPLVVLADVRVVEATRRLQPVLGVRELRPAARGSSGSPSGRGRPRRRRTAVAAPRRAVPRRRPATAGVPVAPTAIARARVTFSNTSRSCVA